MSSTLFLSSDKSLLSYFVEWCYSKQYLFQILYHINLRQFTDEYNGTRNHNRNP